MLARQIVLLTPPKSSHPSQLLSRQQSAPVSPLAATLMRLPASVANKRLTAGLNPLDATLTKNRGVGVVMVNQPFREKAPINELLCFHAIAHSFPRRRSLRSFLFNSFRTLSVTTEGVPPLRSTFQRSDASPPGFL